ncbi:MAG: hypothetical protein EPN88_01090 [Bacteroidetes bacterium]|nr:MAG: hypothetical protein EPN88_01090 [Bacteroidota bacterium]
MDEIKLKVLCILEEKAYQKVGIETIQKELSGIDLYRHLTYLEQKQLIRLSKIGPFAGTTEPQLLDAMLTALGEDIINTAIKRMEENNISVSEGKGRLRRIIESSPYQIVKDVIIPIFAACIS